MTIFKITCSWNQTSMVTIPASVETFQHPISGDQPLNPISFTRPLTIGILYLEIWKRKQIKPISIICWGNTSFPKTENTFYSYNAGLLVAVLVSQCKISRNTFYWYNTCSFLQCWFAGWNFCYSNNKIDKNCYQVSYLAFLDLNVSLH